MKKNGTCRPLVIAAIGMLVFLAAPAPAGAQASGDFDPFGQGAFESAAGPALGGATPAAGTGSSGTGQTSGSEVARIDYLVGGSFLVSATAALPSDFAGYAATASAAGKVFAKVSFPDAGSLYVSYDVSQSLFEGLAGDGSSLFAPPLDLLNPTFQLAEFHYSFDLGKTLFVRLGKQLIAWGPSQIWTPVDFINGQKFDPFSFIDLRVGKPGLRLHLPMGKVNAFAFADFSGLTGGGLTADPASAVNLAGRLDATVGGFELGLTGYGGSKVQKKLGFDFSGDFFGSSLYGETAWAPAQTTKSEVWQATLGFSRALGDLKRWTISAEGFYQSSGGDYTGDIAAMEALSPLYMGSWYGYAALAASELFSPSLSSKLYGLMNFSDSSWSVNLEEDFAFPRSVPFSLLLSWAGGGAAKEFTFLAGDNSLSLTLNALLSF